MSVELPCIPWCWDTRPLIQRSLFELKQLFKDWESFFSPTGTAEAKESGFGWEMSSGRLCGTACRVPSEWQRRAGKGRAGRPQVHVPLAGGVRRGRSLESWELPVAGVGPAPAGHKIWGKYPVGTLRRVWKTHRSSRAKFIQSIKDEFIHLLNSGEWFATNCLCIGNSKQREIIFNAQREGGTFVAELTCSPVSYSKFFCLIKLGWHIRQILDRLAALFRFRGYTVILLWSLPCGNYLFIEKGIYFEMLMTSHTF